MLSEISVKQQVCDTHTQMIMPVWLRKNDSRPDHQQRQSSTWLQMLEESIYMVTNSGLDSQTLLERHNETHGYHLQVLHESR